MNIDFDTGYILNINSIIILIISFLVCLLIAKKINISVILVSILYLWHSLFSIIYYIYSYTARIDTQSYYRGAKDGFLEWRLGNESGAIIIENITSLLIRLFNFSYFNTFLFFHFIGFLGIIVFIKNIYEININNKNNLIIFLILLLPSMHFWTNGIGKDPLTFLFTNLFIYSWLKIYNRSLLLITSIIFMFFIRPYIGVAMISCSFMSILFSKNFEIKTKIIIFFVLTLPALILIKSVIDRIGFGGIFQFETLTFNLNVFVEYMERRNFVTSLSDTSYVNNYFNPLLNYYFKPNIFDINNIFSLIIAFENLFIFIILIISILNIPFSIKFGNFKFFNFPIFFYFIFTSIILSYSVSNYGLAMRQKWMLMPILLLIIINHFPSYKKNIVN